MSKSQKKYYLVLLTFFVIGFLYFLVPPVWQLKSGPVEIDMWRFKGKERVLVGPSEEGWTPYEEISMHLINAIVVAEDAHYFQHNGIDIDAI